MDSTPVSDVCVDDMGKARVMEPIIADKMSNLKELSVNFLKDTERYSDCINEYISIMENLAQQVNQEKQEAIILSNQLSSLTNKTEDLQSILQTEIEQYTFDLERYKTEYRSLQKIESEQQDLISQLSLQH
ncbi:intraflagellar transport protein 20 homolog [Daktulosphaira vitifoliae]|uniref:intraflagellar transport protein 20 homolog n=1 Tax=Daktulosphaira vitifoliae TaxID=58002 RepID=UPI0021AA81B4|nr:intraflagellar transport protein 20 homolog [Daktulosphaira vitifoliae]